MQLITNYVRKYTSLAIYKQHDNTFENERRMLEYLMRDSKPAVIFVQYWKKFTNWVDTLTPTEIEDIIMQSPDAAFNIYFGRYKKYVTWAHNAPSSTTTFTTCKTDYSTQKHLQQADYKDFIVFHLITRVYLGIGGTHDGFESTNYIGSIMDTFYGDETYHTG